MNTNTIVFTTIMQLKGKKIKYAIDFRIMAAKSLKMK